MDFFAIINAVLQLSNYNFRQFAAPWQVPPGAACTPPHHPRYASGRRRYLAEVT